MSRDSALSQTRTFCSESSLQRKKKKEEDEEKRWRIDAVVWDEIERDLRLYYGPILLYGHKHSVEKKKFILVKCLKISIGQKFIRKLLLNLIIIIKLKNDFFLTNWLWLPVFCVTFSKLMWHTYRNAYHTQSLPSTGESWLRFMNTLSYKRNKGRIKFNYFFSSSIFGKPGFLLVAFFVVKDETASWDTLTQWDINKDVFKFFLSLVDIF